MLAGLRLGHRSRRGTRSSLYSLAHPELLDLLSAAERLLDATGSAGRTVFDVRRPAMTIATAAPTMAESTRLAVRLEQLTIG